MANTNRAPINEALTVSLHQYITEVGYNKASVSLGVHRRTIKAALEGRQVRHSTIQKLARIPSKVRTAAEFAPAIKQAWAAPRTRQQSLAWDLEKIRRARDAQQQGDFEEPVQLASMLRTDPALFNAYHRRTDAQSAIATKLTPASGARGESVAKRAQALVHVARSTLKGIHGTLANHGIAIGYLDHEQADGGLEFRLREWPLEFVKYDSAAEILTTRIRESEAVPIRHGDGRWVVFRKFEHKPWLQDACVLPAALVWPASANALSDMASASRSHGIARVLGKLPEGVSLNDEDGNLTPSASTFLDLLSDVVNGDAAAGILPFGSDANFIANGSNAWQVFTELLANREKAAARIYLGTDAILGSIGGAPGVDISALFGIASTIIQGDLQAVEDALYSGVYVPWTAVNFGTSAHAPRFTYVMPDPDAKAKSDEQAEAYDRLLSTIEKMKALGMVVDDATIEALAAAFRVDFVPRLATAAEPTASAAPPEGDAQ